MIRKNFRNERAGALLLLELVLALALILFLYQKVVNSYFKKPVIDKSTEKVLNEQGINTTNYRTIIDTTKSKVEDIEKQHADALEGIR